MTAAAASTPFTVACAVNNDHACHAAIQFAIDVCKRIARGDNSTPAAPVPAPDGAADVDDEAGTAAPYKLYFVYAVSQTPPSTLPYIDHLQTGYNLEAHEGARQDMKLLLAHLDACAADTIRYEFVLLERQNSVGEILKEFSDAFSPDLLIMGTHEKSRLSKFVLGSVSQYCLDNVKCPVSLVKPQPTQ